MTSNVYLYTRLAYLVQAPSVTSIACNAVPIVDSIGLRDRNKGSLTDKKRRDEYDVSQDSGGDAGVKDDRE